MPASNDERMADALYTPEVLHGTDIATPTPITFTTPPPGLMLAEYTQKAITNLTLSLIATLISTTSLYRRGYRP